MYATIVSRASQESMKQSEEGTRQELRIAREVARKLAIKHARKVARNQAIKYARKVVWN